MAEARKDRLVLAGLLVAGAIVFFTGIDWGLPSRDADRFLFGTTQPAWDGKKIIEAGGAWKPDGNRGADQDADPLDLRPGESKALNDTDKDRAQIIRRYRLFSYQPDEMVTFMALAGMRGGLDPRMYQYGGLWIYPVGGLLKIGGMMGLVDLKPDLTNYLDRPEAFGRFYVVARAYSAVWGLIGIWAVYRIGRRLCEGVWLPACMAACFLFMPVVVNAAHEAKPHLAGAVLVLLAVLAAARWIERGRWREVIIAGALCGASMGMVLSGLVAFLILPVMVMLRKETWARRGKMFGVAVFSGIVLYCATNPFVPINLILNPQLIRSNLGALGKAKALVGGETTAGALPTSIQLIAEGASPVLAGLGAIGTMLLVTVRFSQGERKGIHLRPGSAGVGLLLLIPSTAVLGQFISLAAGKLGEFGRFAIIPDVALAIAGIWGMGVICRPRIGRAILGGGFALSVAIFGLSYLMGFVEDASGNGTRVRAARRLAELGGQGLRIGMTAEPAPYDLPPLNMGNRWVLLPPDAMTGRDRNMDVMIYPVEDGAVPGEPKGSLYTVEVIREQRPWFISRISWADKRFELWIRTDLLRKSPVRSAPP